MLGKFIVVAIFIGILFSLGSALYYLVKDKGGSERPVKALTLRVGTSLLLFFLLFVLAWFGVITPHAGP